jgi:hypothetical protein
MTGKAGIQYLAGSHLRERPNRGLSAARLHVLLPWTMTTLAARAFRRFHSPGDALEMGVLIEVEPDIRMAGAAYVTSYVCIVANLGRGCGGRLTVDAEVCA